MQSTPLEQESPSDLEKIESTGQPSQLDETAAALEQRLLREQDARKEERFYWIVALTVVLDVLMFKFLDNGALAFFLLAIEVVTLIGVAKFLGVDGIAVFLEKIVYKWLDGKA